MKSSTNSFVIGALVAVVSTAIGAGTVLSAYSLRSFPGSDARVVDFSEYVRPSTRFSDASPQRDSEMMLRVQERMVNRLQEGESDVLHSAAPEAAPAVRSYYSEGRAYRVCVSYGYTASRLVNCIDSLMRSGIYLPESLE